MVLIDSKSCEFFFNLDGNFPRIILKFPEIVELFMDDGEDEVWIHKYEPESEL